jgi:predicted Zn-dependent protease
MKSYCPLALMLALSLLVCHALTSSPARFAAQASGAESAHAETSRANLLTHDEERSLGNRLAYLYAQQHPTSTNTAQQARLKRVALRLNEATGAGELEINIIKSTRPEAVSFPAGHVFITNALLELARTDDELAAAIAHEAAHVHLRHLARLIELTLRLPACEREYFPTRAAITRGIALHIDFPPALDAERLRYEMEADHLATVWLKRAGYQESALYILLVKMQSLPSSRLQPEDSALRERADRLQSSR